MTQPRRFAPALVQAFIATAFARVGLPEADAQTIAALMTDADMQGSDGHGIIRLLPYITRIESGGVNVRPNIRVINERAATAHIDGDNGMGHLVMKRAAEIAIAKAKIAGMAWVGSVHSNHAGPASLYARMALPEGMLGLYFAVGNANHLPPWGGLDMLLSTNPIAVAIPAGDEPPIVLDMATTVAAYGKIKAKAQRGEQIASIYCVSDRHVDVWHGLRATRKPPCGGLFYFGGVLFRDATPGAADYVKPVAELLRQQAQAAMRSVEHFMEVRNLLYKAPTNLEHVQIQDMQTTRIDSLTLEAGNPG